VVAALAVDPMCWIAFGHGAQNAPFIDHRTDRAVGPVPQFDQKMGGELSEEVHEADGSARDVRDGSPEQLLIDSEVRPGLLCPAGSRIGAT